METGAGRRKPIDVTVLFLERGYSSTAIAPIEVFHSAGALWHTLRGEAATPRFRVRTASVDGKPIEGLCGLRLVPEFGIDQVKRTDIVVLSASGLDVQERIARSSGILAWLRKMHKQGSQVAGICSGVAFLAEAGLLDGREATTHWAVADLLRERYPRVKWKAEQFVTDDSGVLCSGGLYASIDLSLYMVEKYCGHEVALQCARAMLVSMPRASQAGYAVCAPARAHADERIGAAEKHLRRNFRDGVAIQDLADRAGMSPRNFIRRFKAATGRVPGEYLQMLRVSAARERLESEETPIASVGTAVGYEDVAFFRDVFKRHTGMTPAEYRSRFGRMNLARGEIYGGHG